MYQPHATLIALADLRLYPMQGADCKRIETRPRQTHHSPWGCPERKPDSCPAVRVVRRSELTT